MTTFRPTELKKLLSELNITPRKGLSQNFLIDGNIVRKIVHFAEVKKGDNILEIGPGPGALTEALVATRAKVTVIEKDPVFAAHHKVKPRDFLEFPIPKRKKKFKIVANLPYHLTSPILAKILPLYDRIESATVMVQKEVADRMMAKPKSKDYSSFTIFLHFYATPSLGFIVEPTCFYPRPKVRSAVVKLTLKEHPKVSSVEEFFKMTRTAFQQRRKMLRSSLRKIYSVEKIEQALKTLGLDPHSRPEELSLETFLKLFEDLIVKEKT